MKNKILPVMVLASSLVLAGCTLPWSEKPSDSDTLSDTSLSGTTTMTTPSLEDCKKAVEQYLVDAKDLKVDQSKKVEKGANIVVDYVGRLEDGTVFDTSVESVAQACGLYTTQRDYSTGLPFTAGAGQMIAGFDKAVIGMSVNETTTITIPATEAYGDATIAIPLSELPLKPDGSAYKAGESIMTQNGAIAIESMNDKEFTIKNPHPLAGKDLIFDITLKVIN